MSTSSSSSSSSNIAATAPSVLGLRWGDDAMHAAQQVGLVADRWDPWIDPSFETSIDFDHPRPVLGSEGIVRLVRAVADQKLAGVQVIFRGCATDEAEQHDVRAGLARDLAVQDPDVAVPYQQWEDRSLVHFITDARDGTCTLTVAGPRFGAAFADAQLKSGLGDLGAAMTPK